MKVREGTLDDEKTDTGNAAADMHSRISSSDCSHQSGTAATTVKTAGVQITEEQAKLLELEVDLTSTLENESPMKKAKLFDAEEIIMGQELTDNEINLAQQLLKVQFPTLKGLQSTLYQEKEQNLTENDVNNKLQIIHCRSHLHWIVAFTVGCRLGQVKLYDSLFTYCDKETASVIANLFQSRTSCLKPIIMMSRCQKQKGGGGGGGADCGLFAIANATAIAFGKNPCKLQFMQASLRSYLVDCFNSKLISPFPCKQCI